MKITHYKLLLFVLLIVGCDKMGITDDGLDSGGTTITDTLYVYDTLIIHY